MGTRAWKRAEFWVTSVSFAVSSPALQKRDGHETNIFSFFYLQSYKPQKQPPL
jgi:hypothetical protein